jgi:hypothetical protein
MCSRFGMAAVTLALAAFGGVSAGATTEQQSPSCAPRWGKPGAPLVASAQTAKEMFVAVEREFFPRADKAQYPDVDAMDDGKWWSVFRWRDPDRDRKPNGDIVISGGGGQLSMHIDKCTAAISHVFFTR